MTLVHFIKMVMSPKVYEVIDLLNDISERFPFPLVNKIFVFISLFAFYFHKFYSRFDKYFLFCSYKDLTGRKRNCSDFLFPDIIEIL